MEKTLWLILKSMVMYIWIICSFWVIVDSVEYLIYKNEEKIPRSYRVFVSVVACLFFTIWYNLKI